LRMSAGDGWTGVPPSRHPPGKGDGLGSVIGEHRRGRLVPVAINFHNYSGLGAQWWVRGGASSRMPGRPGATILALAAPVKG